MNSIARVIVNLPGINEMFDYDIPAELASVQTGSLVVVPFGRARAQAVIVGLSEHSEIFERKSIAAVLDEKPILTEQQLSLVEWMSEHSLSSLSDCLRLMIPVGINQIADVIYSLKADNPGDSSLTPLQQRIVDEIRERGTIRARQMSKAYPRVNWKASVRSLLRKGVLQSKPFLPDPRVHRKTVRTAQIAQSRTEIDAHLQELGREGGKAFQRRIQAVQFLLEEGIPVNVSWVYASSDATAADLRILEQKGFLRLSEAEIWRDPLAHIEVAPAVVPELTHSQTQAWKNIKAELQDTHRTTPILLHGVTGSGKTELYIRSVEETIRSGKQALVLVPEISLTPQTVKRFMARFPGQVGLVHSRLSTGERYDTWRRARAGEISIIIGPRSALFTPLPDIGLIVLDEFHDQSLYQSSPSYHAVDTALAYSWITGCKVILGSATPDVSTYFKAQSKGWQIVHLPDRILAHQEYIKQKKQQITQTMQPLKNEGRTAASLPLPLVQIVDMRNELRLGNRSMFSRSLKLSLQKVLDRGQQAILFLNRRGSATYVFCRDCGYVLRCPRCDLPLTMHTDRDKLICHSCGYERNMPGVCPECGKTQFRQYGSGTQKVETELSQHFPSARILRWDADSAAQKGAEEILLSHFMNHHADILIGTQMLAKGLDLPLVTLVGIVLADVGLNFPDYRAAERTFQVLTQVAGRSGRSPLGGQVILQTYQPEHYVHQFASKHDFSGFYQDEIVKRRELQYPPFGELFRLEFRHHDEETAASKARELVDLLLTKRGSDPEYSNIIISGPVPPFFSKLRGKYRQHIILRGEHLHAFLEGIDLRDWMVEYDPPDLL